MELEKPQRMKTFGLILEKAGNILEAVIYFASNKGKMRLPTIEEFVLSELVTSTGEYLSGRKDFSGYFRRRENGKHCLHNDNWQIKMSQFVEDLFSKFGGKLPREFSEALKQLVTLEHQYSHGEKWWDCLLYDFYKDQTKCNPMISTFSLSVEFVDRVESNILFLLTQEEIEHIKAIASCMERYVEEDLEFIKKQYHW